MKKIYITALVIVLIVIIVIIVNSNKKVESDYFVSKYSPNSLAYFVCKSKGLVEGNTCKICEDLFMDINNRRQELKIENDIQFVAKVKELNGDCVSKVQGGN